MNQERARRRARVERNTLFEHGRVDRQLLINRDLLAVHNDGATAQRRIERDLIASDRVQLDRFAQRNEAVVRIDDIRVGRNDDRGLFDLEVALRFSLPVLGSIWLTSRKLSLNLRDFKI